FLRFRVPALLFPRRKAQHDVKACCQLVDARIANGCEFHNQRLASFTVADGVKNAVVGVAALAPNVALRGEVFAAANLDFEVNVWRSARIRNRLDSAEIIFAAGACKKAAKALKIRVAVSAVAAAGVQIGAVIVNLPDFDGGVANGIAAG